MKLDKKNRILLSAFSICLTMAVLLLVAWLNKGQTWWFIVGFIYSSLLNFGVKHLSKALYKIQSLKTQSKQIIDSLENSDNVNEL